MRQSWHKNREKTTKQSRSNDTETAPGREPAGEAATLTYREAVNLGIQTPELPKPFYAGTHSEGSRYGLDFGVQTKDGEIYAFIEKDVTEEVTSSIGIGYRFQLKQDRTFFTRAGDVLLYVPKRRVPFLAPSAIIYEPLN